MASKSTHSASICMPSWLLIFGLLLWLTVATFCDTTTRHPDLLHPDAYTNIETLKELKTLLENNREAILDAYGSRLKDQQPLDGKVYSHTDYDRILKRAEQITNEQFDNPGNVLLKFRNLVDQSMKDFGTYIGPKHGKHWCYSYWIVKINPVIREILDMAKVDPAFYSKLTKRHFAALEEMTVYFGSGRLVRMYDHFVVESAMDNGESRDQRAFHTYLKISFRSEPSSEYLVIKMRSFDSTEACRLGEMVHIWPNKNVTMNTKTPDMIQFVRAIPEEFFPVLLSPQVLHFIEQYDRESSLRGLDRGNYDIIKAAKFFAKPRVRAVVPSRRNGPRSSWVNGLNSRTVNYERSYVILKRNVKYNPDKRPKRERQVTLTIATTIPYNGHAVTVDFQFPNWVQSTNLKYRVEYFGKTLLYNKPELRKAFREKMNVFFFDLAQRVERFASQAVNEDMTLFHDVFFQHLLPVIYIIPYQLEWKGHDLEMGLESLKRVHAAIEQEFWVKTLRKNKELCRLESDPPMAEADKVLVLPIPARFISIRPVLESEGVGNPETSAVIDSGDEEEEEDDDEYGKPAPKIKVPRKCPFCASIPNPTSTYYGHVGTHYGRTLFYDPVCRTFFASVSSYSDHRRRLPHYAMSKGANQPLHPTPPGINRPFGCRKQGCITRFFYWTDAGGHYKSVHDEEIKITDLNYKGYVSEGDALEFEEVTGVDPFVCEYVKCCFSWKSHDSRHTDVHKLMSWTGMKKDHYKSRNSKRWDCKECPKNKNEKETENRWCTALSMTELPQHMEDVHKMPVPEFFSQRDVLKYFDSRLPDIIYDKFHFVCIFELVKGTSGKIDHGATKVLDVAVHVIKFHLRLVYTDIMEKLSKNGKKPTTNELQVYLGKHIELWWQYVLMQDDAKVQTFQEHKMRKFRFRHPAQPSVSGGVTLRPRKMSASDDRSPNQTLVRAYRPTGPPLPLSTPRPRLANEEYQRRFASREPFIDKLLRNLFRSKRSPETTDVLEENGQCAAGNTICPNPATTTTTRVSPVPSEARGSLWTRSHLDGEATPACATAEPTSVPPPTSKSAGELPASTDLWAPFKRVMRSTEFAKQVAEQIERLKQQSAGKWTSESLL